MSSPEAEPFELSARDRAIEALIELNRGLSDVWRPTMSSDDAAHLLAGHVGAVRVLLGLIDDGQIAVRSLLDHSVQLDRSGGGKPPICSKCGKEEALHYGLTRCMTWY